MTEEIKTLKKPKRKQIPCLLCGELLEIKLTVKHKPYFQCDPCGLQVFVRRQAGIDLLDSRLKTHGRVPEIEQGISRLKALRAELGQLEDEAGFFDWLLGNEDQEAAREALEGEIKRAQDDLKALGKDKGKE